ncbi:MAG TPA: type IV secretion system protein, partial [Novosphingobium sp.]|nr:type IV secretion system protein [Novosphingobium sp.]
LLIAWLIVILAFFILSVQLFVTILEFKLTSLAGFILVPFALWGRTHFLAERVLGNVVTSGIKVMVLAIIVGIGSTYFSQFTTALQGQQPDIGQAMSLVLASLALFGLGIFGPGIATGLVAGAPQLGAGSAAATTALAAGGLAAGGMAGAGAARLAGSAGLGAIRAGTAMGSAASTAYKLGQETAGSASVGAGLGGIATAASGMAEKGIKAAAERMAAPLRASAEQGRQAAWGAGATRQSAAGAAGGAGAAAGAPAGSAPDAMPAWARDLQSTQTARHHRQMAIHALQSGDRGGHGATPDIDEKD